MSPVGVAISAALAATSATAAASAIATRLRLAFGGRLTFRHGDFFFVFLGLFFFHEVEQQRRQTALLQGAGNKLVSRTEPTAAAAVGEGDDALRIVRNSQDAAQSPPPSRNLDLAFHCLRTGSHRTDSLTLSDLAEQSAVLQHPLGGIMCKLRAVVQVQFPANAESVRAAHAAK